MCLYVMSYSSCATSNLKKVSLELGGKSPLVIFADCNMDMAVRQVRLGGCAGKDGKEVDLIESGLY